MGCSALTWITLRQCVVMKSSCLSQTCGFGSVYEDTGSFKHALVLLTHHTYKQELWRPCYFTAFHWVYCVNKKHLQNSSWSVSNAIRGNYSIGHKVKSLFYANCISWPAALSLPNSPMFVKLHCKEWCNVLLLMPVYLKVVLSLPSIFFHQVSSSDIYCRDCSRRPPTQNKLHVTKWKLAHQYVHQKNVVQAQPKSECWDLCAFLTAYVNEYVCVFICAVCTCIYKASSPKACL